MPVITIPFDYDPQKYGESLVPIFVNDTDDSGNKIYFGWIEAVVPVQDKLRTLAKRVLGDIWRVSELTDETVHHLWSRYRENLGPRPSHRVYTTAQYKVHSLEDPGGRFHRGKHVALDALDALQQDVLAAQCTPPQRASSWANRLSDLENKLQGHHPSCLLAARCRFGGSYPHNLHYDCEPVTQLDANYPNCHGAGTRPGANHVNICPNDYII